MTMIRDEHTFFFLFFGFPVSNFKCNLIFLNFEFVTRQRNNKRLTIELVTRSGVLFLLSLYINTRCW